MLKKHSQLFEGLFMASDLLVVSCAWAASYWVRFASELIPIDKGIPLFSDYMRMLIFVWLIWAFVFRRFGLYRPMRASRRLYEIWLLMRANAFSVLLLLSATYLFREKSVPFSRAVFGIFLLFSTLGTMASREVIRAGLRNLRRKGYNLRFALIVGADKLAERVASKMISNPEFGIVLVGCLSDGERFDHTAEEISPSRIVANSSFAYLRGMRGMRAAMPQQLVLPTVIPNVRSESVPEPSFAAESNEHPTLPLKVVGTYDSLQLFLEDGRIDQVIIALPLHDLDKLESIVAAIGDHMVDVRIVPDVHRFIQLGSQIEEFDGLPVVSLASTPLAGYNRLAKRIFDVLFGSFLFVLSAPVMLLIAILVRLSSKGPIVYAQERVGLDGRTFKIYKFRTMRLDAEEGGAKWAVPGDNRVTWLGRILRRLSLDELPQLFNVLRGEMSLVGPRPERPVFIREFRRHVPKYMLRHKVQAGMTGWAQVNGWRGNTSIERRIEHDLFYIENWSLFLDLKIIFLTLVRTISDRNAY